MEPAPTLIESKFLAQDPASDVIRAALEVHRSLGPGLDPELYQRAMELEMDERGLRWWRDVFVELQYKGRRLGKSRVPLVAGGLLVSLRVAAGLSSGDVALVSAQAKTLGCGGLLLNFGADHLEIRRVRSKPAGR